MKYPVIYNNIIDVTKPPYNADNTGKTDCTDILIKILDDVLIRSVTALKETHDKLMKMSDNLKENVYLGYETGRVQNGKLVVTFPEKEPSAKIIYFPKGTYLVSNTVTYTLNNLKQFWYHVPGMENCRNIHFTGEDRENTVIKLADNSKGFEKGCKKPVISFVNNEMKEPEGVEYTNVAFMNTLEDITIDCGKGNPGATGVRYVSSNCGRIENVTIKADEGVCGIYNDITTQAVYSDLCIRGFDYGIYSEKTAMLFIDSVDVSENKIAGIHTNHSTIICGDIISGNIPAIKFNEKGIPEDRCYLINTDISLENAKEKNIYREKQNLPLRGIPANKRSENPQDWVCVDDFGAKGDGITDSSKAIQSAMDSGKPIVVFGEGEYLINKKIKIPETVKTVDFMFCSLACGTRLIGGEYDSAFEVSQDSKDLLFIENLSAWENFRGHIRLVKHSAKRDVVLSDIHLMSAALYFNSVQGSNVYFDNCFSTSGTYTRSAWIPGDGFVPVYSRIIPYEIHGQKVYGRVVNPERADLAMLNDNSEILLDGFRTEGCGTAIKSINKGTVQINIFNAGIGCREAENPLFEIEDSYMKITGAIAFGYNTDTEYNNIISDRKNKVEKMIKWDDLEKNISPHGKIIDEYISR